MTNLKLTIEGDASMLAMVLASLGAVEINATVEPEPIVIPPLTPAPVAVPAAEPDSDVDDVPELDSAGIPWDERIHSTPAKTKKDGTWYLKKGVDKASIPAIEAELKTRVASGEPAPVPPMPANPEPAPVPPMPANPEPVDEPEQPVVAPSQPIPIPTGPTSPTVPTPMPVISEPPVQNVAPVAPQQRPAPQPVLAVPTGATVAPATMPPPAAAAPAAAAPAAAAAPVQLDGAQFMQHVTGKMGEKDADGQPLIDVAYLDGVVAEINTAFNVELKVITDIFGNQDQINYAVGCLQRDGRW